MTDESDRIEVATAGVAGSAGALGPGMEVDTVPAAGLPAVRPGSTHRRSLRVRCLSCHVEMIVEEGERTAAKELVRIACGTCRKRTIAALLEDPETGSEIDLVAEAARIFAEDLPPKPEPRATAPDPPTLEELGLRPPEPEPAEDHVQAAYREWMETEDGRTVAKAIRDRALELRRRGWPSYGIQAIAEVVRFDRALRVGPSDGFRVNNSHLSRLARDLMTHYPELDGFFEVRALRST